MTVLSQDILDRFDRWLTQARGVESILEPTAMSLATVRPDGTPAVRVVLLKGIDARGLVFYTNYQSHKAEDLDHLPRAALGFHWDPLRKQIRVRGSVEKVSEAESDAYFASRPVGSQLGAWASLQSQPMERYEVLMERFAEFHARFGDQVPRPPHWGGYRVIPERVEFWSSLEDRLHRRDVFVRTARGWDQELLFP